MRRSGGAIRLCILGTFPPVVGGVSRYNYWLADMLGRAGHRVSVVTNADEVEPAYRMVMTPRDRAMREPRHPGGGSVEVATSTALPDATYIPFAQPYVTKLASIATEVVRRRSCDLIFAHSFEPYALAACLASTWTGVPFVVLHADGDLDRLVSQPELRTSYVEMLKRASFVLTYPGFVAWFEKLGIRSEQIALGRAGSLPTHVFNPRARKLDVDRVLASQIRSNPWLHPGYKKLAQKRFDPAIPTIGFYGRPSAERGAVDLLHALREVKRKGLRFQFLATIGGLELPSYLEDLDRLGLEDVTWLSPYVPHWRIPSYLRTLTAVCSVERQFSVAIHAPIIPREAFACGTCLLMSGEIANKLVYRSRLRDRHNFVAVGDPRNHLTLSEKLSRVISAPDEAREIGKRGHALSATLEDFPAAVKRRDELFRLLSAGAAVLARRDRKPG